MGKVKYLIDTSAVIKYLNNVFSEPAVQQLDSILEKESVVSFITEIELLAWNPADPQDMEVFRRFIQESIVLGIDKELIQETIRIRKDYRLKIPDAMIAASALLNDRLLIADNDKDFLKIPALRVLNPAQL